MSEDELKKIREQYISRAQSDDQAVKEAEEAQKQAQLEAWRQGILRKILSEGAKMRLANIRLVKPDRATMVENQLIQLYQAGRISSMISEEQLLAILRQLSSSQRDSRIEFRRS